jgi:hypothetical protein
MRQRLVKYKADALEKREILKKLKEDQEESMYSYQPEILDKSKRIVRVK